LILGLVGTLTEEDAMMEESRVFVKVMKCFRGDSAWSGGARELGARY
jgi:hypothetical protein